MIYTSQTARTITTKTKLLNSFPAQQLQSHKLPTWRKRTTHPDESNRERKHSHQERQYHNSHRRTMRRSNTKRTFPHRHTNPQTLPSFHFRALFFCVGQLMTVYVPQVLANLFAVPKFNVISATNSMEAILSQRHGKQVYEWAGQSDKSLGVYSPDIH